MTVDIDVTQVETKWLVIQETDGGEADLTAMIWSEHDTWDEAWAAKERAEQEDAEWLQEMRRDDPAGSWLPSDYTVTGAREWYSSED